jgi:hypothetical protein
MSEKKIDPVAIPAVVSIAPPRLVGELGLEKAIKIAQDAKIKNPQNELVDAATIAKVVTENWSKIASYRVANLVPFVKSQFAPKRGLSSGKVYYIGSGDGLKNVGDETTPKWEPNGIAPYFIAGTDILGFKIEKKRADDLKIIPGQLITGMKAGSGFAITEEGTGQTVPDLEVYQALAAIAGTPEFFVDLVNNGKFSKYQKYVFEGRIKYITTNALPDGVAKIVIIPAGKSDWTVEVSFQGKQFGRAWLAALGDAEFQELRDAEDKAECLSQFYPPDTDVICMGIGAGKPDRKWNVFAGKTKLWVDLVSLLPRPAELPPLEIVEREEPEEVPPSSPEPSTPAPAPKRASREPPPTKLTVGGEVLDVEMLRAEIIKKTGLSVKEIEEKVKAKTASLKGLIKDEAALVVVAKELGIDTDSFVKKVQSIETKPKPNLADRINIAKMFVEAMARANPNKNWVFSIEDYNEMSNVEGAPEDFTDVFPFSDFEKFCAEKHGLIKVETPKVEVPAVSKADAPKIETPPSPVSKPAPEPPAPEIVPQPIGEVTGEIRDNVYEFILTNDTEKGKGVPFQDIVKGFPAIRVPLLKKTIDSLVKETAITISQPLCYKPL